MTAEPELAKLLTQIRNELTAIRHELSGPDEGPSLLQQIRDSVDAIEKNQ
jgi:hypothetical protein